MIINYSKDGEAVSDFKAEQYVLNAYKEGKDISVSTDNTIMMARVLIYKGIIKYDEVTFKLEGQGEIIIDKRARFLGGIPNGFHDFFDNCLDVLIDI